MQRRGRRSTSAPWKNLGKRCRGWRLSSKQMSPPLSGWHSREHHRSRRSPAKQNPIYYNYELLKDALSKTAPHLMLCTTQGQFSAALRAKVGPASRIKRAVAVQNWKSLVRTARSPCRLRSVPVSSQQQNDCNTAMPRRRRSLGLWTAR